MKKILLFLFALILNVCIVKAESPTLIYFNQHAVGAENSGSSRFGIAKINDAKYEVYRNNKLEGTLSYTVKFNTPSKSSYGKYIIKQVSKSTGYIDELLNLEVNISDHCFESRIDITKTPMTHEISFKFPYSDHSVSIVDSNYNTIYYKSKYRDNDKITLYYDKYSVYFSGELFAVLDTTDLDHIYDSPLFSGNFNGDEFTTTLNLNIKNDKPVVKITCTDINGNEGDPNYVSKGEDNNEKNNNVSIETNISDVKKEDESKTDTSKKENSITSDSNKLESNDSSKVNTNTSKNSSSNSNTNTNSTDKSTNTLTNKINFVDDILVNNNMSTLNANEKNQTNEKNQVKKEDKNVVKTSNQDTKNELLSLIDDETDSSITFVNDKLVESPSLLKSESLNAKETNKGKLVIKFIFFLLFFPFIVLLLLLIYQKYTKKMQKS